MRKPLVFLVAILVIISIVIGGCASQPAGTTAPTTSAPSTAAKPAEQTD